jgi:putative transcriptional regulator
VTTKRKSNATGALKGKERLRAELVEAAQGLGEVGLMDPETVDKITVRMLGPDELPAAVNLTAKEIMAIREDAGMSQTVFARLLSVSTGTLSKWERGEIAPRGPARRLLLLIKIKGVDAVL